MTTEWSLDFCLVCDRQTHGGPYCSQTCRLAELDLVYTEVAVSGTLGTSRENPKKAQRNSTSGIATNQYHTIDENINFISNSSRSSRTLSPSSSQTSLSSLKSSSSQASTPSDRIQNELRDYASSFDQIRDLKRRLTYP